MITRPYLHGGRGRWCGLVKELRRLCHLIVSVEVISTMLMATVHVMPLEDTQESHIVVVMIIVVTGVVIIAIGGWSVTGTAA